jgi:hypothetical protein
MATNRTPKPATPKPADLPLPVVPGDAWVTALTQPAPPERFLWCDECHYWHAEVNECAYTSRVGL